MRETLECLEFTGGVKMATNLATFVYVGKSEKLQKHSLIELTLTAQIAAPKVMSGSYQIDAEPLAFSWVNAK